MLALRCARVPVGRVLALFGFFCSTVTPTTSQEYLDTAGRWKYAHLRVLSGLDTDRDSAGQIWFYDSLIGYATDGPAASFVVYRTTDGGATWASTRSYYAPRVRYDVDSAFAFGGDSWSSDRGVTWQPDAMGDTAVIYIRGSDRRTMAAIVQLRSQQCSRLMFSTDSGRTWIPLDSYDSTQRRLARSGPFGDLPADAWWNGRAPEWAGLEQFFASRRFVARLKTIGAGYQEYLGTFDLDNRTVRWIRIPAGAGLVHVLSESHLYYFRYRNYRPEWLVVSTDAGGSWDSVATPPSLDTMSFRMLSTSLALSISHRTYDAGRTWDSVVHPFHGGGRFGAVPDAAHMFLMANYSLMARSSDTGHTWRQNAAGPPPRAVATRDGHVVIGRTYRSILVSADSGETCHELGSIGAVPRDMATVWALAWPDSVLSPHRVVGVAGFRRQTGAYEVCAIESDDDGFTWQEGMRLPSLDSLLGTLEPDPPHSVRARDYSLFYARSWNAITMTFVRNSHSPGTTGFIAVQRSLLRTTDNGASWSEICDSIVFARLTMVDERRGVAASVLTVPKPGALYRTTDGGLTWRWTLTLHSPAHYISEVGWLGGSRWQVLAPDPDLILHDDRFFSFRSEDDGQTWTFTTMYRNSQAGVGHLLWLDTADLHVFQPGARINHSTDGGETFTMLHPMDTAVFDIVKYAFDGSYVYAGAPGNTVGRWRIARRWRALSTVGDERVAWDVRLGEREIVVRPAREPILMQVFDVMGRMAQSRRIHATSGADRPLRVGLHDLADGSWFVSLTTQSGRILFRITIVAGRVIR